MTKSTYWVYIILCSNQAYYTGYTNNLEKRYQAHVKGVASKYTRSFKPIAIVQFWEIEEGKSAAMRVERLIKQLSREDKEKLIATPSLIRAFAQMDSMSSPRKRG